MIVQQLGTRHAREQDRGVPCEVGDVLDELEELRLGPLQIVDREDDRPIGREVLQERSDRPERLLGRAPASRDADRLSHQLRDPARDVTPPRERLELGAGHLGRVGLVQTRDLDERLGQGVEGDALAVGEAAATEDGRPIAHLVEEGRHQPRLADAPDAEDGEQLTGVVAHRPLEGAPQQRELSFPPDHGCVEVPGEPGRPRRDLDEAEREQRIGLSLGGHGLDRVHDHRVAHEREGGFSQQDLARSGGLLEARGDVHRVPRRDPLVAGPGHDFAGVHPDPAGEGDPVIAAEVVVQRVERRAHVGCRPHRPERIVLVDLGNAEDRHDRIADELLDGSAVTLDGGPHRVEEALHHSSQRFRVEPIAHRGRADDIAEDDRDRLASLGPCLGPDEGRAALPAELAGLGVGMAARPARDHLRSLWQWALSPRTQRSTIRLCSRYPS